MKKNVRDKKSQNQSDVEIKEGNLTSEAFQYEKMKVQKWHLNAYTYLRKETNSSDVIFFCK